MTENVNLPQEVMNALFLIHWNLSSQLHIESQDPTTQGLTLRKARVEPRVT